MRVEIMLDIGNGVGEGPFWDDRENRLWWVDITRKEILAWSPGQPAASRWPAPDFPCAIIARERGDWLLGLRSGLFSWHPDGSRLEVVAAPDAERPDNRSNEAKCDPWGRVWLGTMQNNLNPDGSGRAMTGATGALYCVRPDGRWTREVDGVGLANTLAWTDSGRTLLFGDTMTNVISRFTMAEDGSLSNRRVFSDEALPGACDGSAIDAEGCLWNARFGGGRVIRFRPDGRVDRAIPLPVTNPTSCCFGGPGLRTLYVTSARFSLSDAQLAQNPHEGALLAIEADVEGTPSCRFQG